MSEPSPGMPVDMVDPAVTVARFSARQPRGHGIAGFVARRLLLGVATVFLASLLIFAATQALPGDAARSILGKTATPEALAALREQLRLGRVRSSSSTSTGSAASSPATSADRSRPACR